LGGQRKDDLKDQSKRPGQLAGLKVTEEQKKPTPELGSFGMGKRKNPSGLSSGFK
jgi:hypothetical protein